MASSSSSSSSSSSPSSSSSATPPFLPLGDLVERTKLIQRISRATGRTHIDSVAHCMLWLSEIEVLRELAQLAESGSFGRTQASNMFERREQGVKVIKSWLARRGASDVDKAQASESDTASASAASSASPGKRGRSESDSKPPRLIKRQKAPRDAASERDNGTCVVMKTAEAIEVCHIYPYAMVNMSDTQRQSFWNLLANFWTEATLDKWKRDIIGQASTEATQNQMCLSILVQDLWGKASFAFEPIGMSEDKKSLELRFWWLPAGKYSLRVPICDAPSFPSDLKASALKCKLLDCESEQIICSGHVIKMTTLDPMSMPLPSIELLQMQWNLHRVAALSGAADVPDEVLDEDDDDSDGFGGDL